MPKPYWRWDARRRAQRDLERISRHRRLVDRIYAYACAADDRRQAANGTTLREIEDYAGTLVSGLTNEQLVELGLKVRAWWVAGCQTPFEFPHVREEAHA